MKKPRIGEILVSRGQLTKKRLREALELQAIVGGRLGTTLLDMGAVDEDTLLAYLGEQRSSKAVTAADLRGAHPAVVKMVRKKLAERYRIVPFDLRGKTLFLASANPIDPFLEDEIGMLTSCMVRSCIALELRIYEALEIFYDIPMGTRYSSLVRRLDAGVSASMDDGEAASFETPATVAPSPVASPPPERAPSPPVSSVPDPSHPARPSSPAPEASRPEPAPAVEEARPDPPSFIELDAEDAALLQTGQGPIPEAEKSGTFQWLHGPGEAPPNSPAAPAPPAPAAVSPEPAAPAPAAPAPAAPEPTAPAPAAQPATAGHGLSASSLEERLAAAARDLQEAEIRDEIADVLLDFCTPFFARRMLLIRRSDRILGWRAGEDTPPEMVRAVEIGTAEASVFLSASNFWLGPLPPLPANENLVLAFGGGRPKDCVVLPITLRSKIVCYLYGDNGDRGVGGAPIAELKRLAAKAGIAFEVLIYKNKIRMI